VPKTPNNTAAQISQHLAKEQAELLDIVNAQDEFIGQHTRGGFYTSELHASGGLLRFAHIFLKNDAGDILLQQRSATKSNHPNLLDLSAAGHVSAGDSYEQAAYREMQEEIGITTDLTPLFKRHVGRGFAQVFTGSYNGKITPDPAEVKATHWHTPEDINTLFTIAPYTFSSGLKESWPHFYIYLKTGALPQDNHP